MLWEEPIVEHMAIAHETMSPRDRTDKPAVRHVSEG